MRGLAAALAVLLASGGATPSHASGDILCEGDNVSIDMLVGRLQVLSVLRAVVRIGDKTWSSDQSYEAGTPIEVGQRFEDDRMLLIDFTDESVDQILGRLRAFTLQDGNDSVTAGVFSMKDEGVHVVDCSLRG